MRKLNNIQKIDLKKMTVEWLLGVKIKTKKSVTPTAVQIDMVWVQLWASSSCSDLPPPLSVPLPPQCPHCCLPGLSAQLSPGPWCGELLPLKLCLILPCKTIPCSYTNMCPTFLECPVSEHHSCSPRDFTHLSQHVLIIKYDRDNPWCKGIPPSFTSPSTHQSYHPFQKGN